MGDCSYFLVPTDVLDLCVVTEVNKWIKERLDIYILVATRVPNKLNSNPTIMRGVKRGTSGVSQTNRHRKIDK